MACRKFVTYIVSFQPIVFPITSCRKTFGIGTHSILPQFDSYSLSNRSVRYAVKVVLGSNYQIFSIILWSGNIQQGMTRLYHVEEIAPSFQGVISTKLFIANVDHGFVYGFEFCSDIFLTSDVWVSRLSITKYIIRKRQNISEFLISF